MSDDQSTPYSVQVLARLNAALEASGLADRKGSREPLPMFRQQLDEWFSNQNVPLGASDEETIEHLLQSQSAADIQAAFRTIFEEIVQLSSAHSTLSVWTRRELDHEIRRLQHLVEQAQKGPGSNVGY